MLKSDLESAITKMDEFDQIKLEMEALSHDRDQWKVKVKESNRSIAMMRYFIC